MITKIEIDGFKTFKEFKVELGPFQVIVGPNGSGKSNLFDALHLLARLADTDLLSAFQDLRGDAGELFMILPHGQSVERMRLAVEMLVDRKVLDDLGRQVELRYTRLRYELEVTLHSDKPGWEALSVTHESLRSIAEDADNWCRKYGLSAQNNWLSLPTGGQASFISTTLPAVRGKVAEAAAAYDPDTAKAVTATDTVTLSLHQDDQGNEKTFVADKVKRTVLSSVTDTDFPHAFAAREEMRSWRFLHLNPEVLRLPSAVRAASFLSANGGNLPTTLARMQNEDKFTLTDISRAMANLVPGILEIRVEQDKASDKYVIYAETADRRSFSSQVLSDGTLRLLALATLRNDLHLHGVLCIEEPENGVDTLHLAKMAGLLREMATDFSDVEQVEEPLRQLLVTTHSPVLISQPDVRDFLLLAIVPTQVQGKSTSSVRVTRMVPVVTPNTWPSDETETDKAVEVYTIDMVKTYLDSDTLDEARDQLTKARTRVVKR